MIDVGTRSSLFVSALAVVLGLACAEGSPARPDGGATPSPDASLTAADASTAPDADSDAGQSSDGGTATDAGAGADAPPSLGGHLLLSEVTLEVAGSEFIEIYNPTGQVVSLAEYYLADFGNYYRLPAGTSNATSSDFIARFPASASIGAGAVVTVALASAVEFQAAFGVAPTFSLGTPAGSTLAMALIDGGTAPTLTNAGEPVVLFKWNGTSDLVTDIDMVQAGEPSALNLLEAKTGQSIDGPDADAVASTYSADALTLGTQTMTPGPGNSTKRLLRETGFETAAGGNGMGGHDETSETISMTWDAPNFTAPTPGTVPTSLSQ